MIYYECYNIYTPHIGGDKKGVNFMKKESFIVEGIKCQNCVNTIKKGLDETKGIISYEISLSDKRVEIEFDESKTNIKKLIKAIEKTGYKVNK